MSVYNGASNKICKYMPEKEAINIAFFEKFCLILKKPVNFWTLSLRAIIIKERAMATTPPPKKECKNPCREYFKLKNKTTKGSISIITLATKKVVRLLNLLNNNPKADAGPK